MQMDMKIIKLKLISLNSGKSIFKIYLLDIRQKYNIKFKNSMSNLKNTNIKK